MGWTTIFHEKRRPFWIGLGGGWQFFTQMSADVSESQSGGLEVLIFMALKKVWKLLVGDQHLAGFREHPLQAIGGYLKMDSLEGNMLLRWMI